TNRVSPFGQTCGNGSFSWKPMDVQIQIMFDDNLDTVFNFNNPNFGAPTVTQDPNMGSAANGCGIGDVPTDERSGIGFTADCFDDYGDAGVTQTYVDRDGYHGMVITRLADNDMKQFEVTVRQ
ncbi:MAG: hypothetical protein ACKOW5_13100, partial [Actinomycetales bacterium]